MITKYGANITSTRELFSLKKKKKSFYFQSVATYVFPFNMPFAMSLNFQHTSGKGRFVGRSQDGIRDMYQTAASYHYCPPNPTQYLGSMAPRMPQVEYLEAIEAHCVCRHTSKHMAKKWFRKPLSEIHNSLFSPDTMDLL